jgi:nicotinamidase/pyrazinamidase
MMKKTYILNQSDALLITDIQKDFLPGGALPVEGGDEIIPVLNACVKRFEGAGAHVLASRDWHPKNHVSFKSQGGPWPPHCVQHTAGAEFSPDLKLPRHTVVISKAIDPNKESYSAFDETNLGPELKTMGVKRLFVGGLATDYCVLYTVLDACKLGFEVVVLMDAILGIDVNPGDVDNAVAQMLQSGAQQVTAVDFPDDVDALPIEETDPDALAEKPSERAEDKKKARMRSRGSAKRLPTERRG